MKHLALAFVVLLPLSCFAEDGLVSVLYLMNRLPQAADIWVDGDYQGMVPAGSARYTVREGFVTRDSGVQRDGSVKNTYAHAGWNARGSVKVVIRSRSKLTNYRAQILVSGDKERKAYVWFGDSAGAEPDSLVWENSSPIVRSGDRTPPSDWDVYVDAEIRAKGLKKDSKEKGIAGGQGVTLVRKVLIKTYNGGQYSGATWIPYQVRTYRLEYSDGSSKEVRESD